MQIANYVTASMHIRGATLHAFIVSEPHLISTFHTRSIFIYIFAILFTAKSLLLEKFPPTKLKNFRRFYVQLFVKLVFFYLLKSSCSARIEADRNPNK